MVCRYFGQWHGINRDLVGDLALRTLPAALAVARGGPGTPDADRNAEGRNYFNYSCNGGPVYSCSGDLGPGARAAVVCGMILIAVRRSVSYARYLRRALRVLSTHITRVLSAAGRLLDYGCE
jgi:hypothetical protein